MDRELLKLVYAFGGYGILLYVFITMMIAGALSFAIGLERQLRGEAAGVRTHALLSVGCSLLMTISIWAIRIADGSIDIMNGAMIPGSATADINYDTSRIAAGVVTGIGFLGGGVIIRDKFSVKGLATASTLWICSAIGLACGAGFVLEAIIATAVTVATLIALGKLIDFIDDRSPSLIVTVSKGYPIVSEMRNFSEKNGYTLKNVKITSFEESGMTAKVSFALATDKMTLRYICEQFSQEPDVIDIKVSEKEKKR